MITYKVHQIQSGEDFSILARNYLGDARRWNEIAQANPQFPIRYVSGIPYVTLKVGDMVRVPITVADPAPEPDPAPAPSVVDTQDIVVSPPSPPSYPEKESYKDEPAATKTESDSGYGSWIKWLLLVGLGWAALGGMKGKSGR